MPGSGGGGGAVQCCVDADCPDDGLACTDDVCVDAHCTTRPGAVACDWPAEQTPAATNLTPVEGPAPNDFEGNLSGSVWDPIGKTLWVCRNSLVAPNLALGAIWALQKDMNGGMVVADKNGERAEWNVPGDTEDLTIADFTEPDTLYTIAETEHEIREFDLSTGGTAVQKNAWDIKKYVPPYTGGNGPEAITFVPDSFLKAQGFTDAGGSLYESVQGMGGLMFVGHQNGGALYAFDLNRTNGFVYFVGSYLTHSKEVAALHFDRSTGQLYIWHGNHENSLEVARLSSHLVGVDFQVDALRVYKGPSTPVMGSDNMEGIGLSSATADCVNGKRDFWLQIDDGGPQSLFWYHDFPCY